MRFAPCARGAHPTRELLARGTMSHTTQRCWLWPNPNRLRVCDRARQDELRPLCNDRPFEPYHPHVTNTRLVGRRTPRRHPTAQPALAMCALTRHLGHRAEDGRTCRHYDDDYYYALGRDWCQYYCYYYYG